MGTTLEFLINFGFRKPALRVGIIPAGRNSTSTVPSLAGEAQAGHTLSLPGTVTPSPLIEWYLTPLRCPAGVQPGPARAARRDRSAWRSRRGGAEVVADGAMAAESRAASALPALAAEASSVKGPGPRRPVFQESRPPPGFNPGRLANGPGAASIVLSRR